jgi:HEAT repeat protein
MKPGTPALLALGLALAAVAPAAQTPAQWQDVIRNLRHPNAETRLSAVTRLGEAAYLPAAEPLATLITDPDDRVQVAAIEAEISLFQADRIGSGRILGMGGSRSRAQEAFEAGPLLRGAAPAPPVVIERLISAIRDENARVRFDALHAVGFIAEAPFVGPQARLLAAELDHYDPIIRAATARVLGRLRASTTGDLVAVGLVDSSSVVRLYATEALGLIRDPKAVIELRAQLPRSRGDIQAATFLALARIGSRDDIEFFRARLTDRAEVFRRAAVEGLGRAGDKDSIDSFDRVFKTDRAPAVRLAAAFALNATGRVETHTIASMLALSDVAAQARDYLLEIGRPAVAGIQSALKVATDGRHRADLVQLVGYIGGAEDIGLLEPLAAEKDERVRRAVAHAIARLKAKG